MPATIVQDAAYTTVGVGVLGFQQAQLRRREAQAKLARLARDTRSRAQAKAKATIPPAFVRARDWLAERGTEARAQVEPLVIDVRERLEPVVDQLRARLDRLTGKPTPNGAAQPEPGA